MIVKMLAQTLPQSSPNAILSFLVFTYCACQMLFSMYLKSPLLEINGVCLSRSQDTNQICNSQRLWPIFDMYSEVCVFNLSREKEILGIQKGKMCNLIKLLSNCFPYHENLTSKHNFETKGKK